MFQMVGSAALAATRALRRIRFMLHTIPRRRWVLAIEVALALAILCFVVAYFRGLLQKMPADVPFRLRVDLLALSGVLYLAAHLCWATSWLRMLHFEGVNVPWGIGLRAYYISQFGKYVPGKIAVLFMRVGMLRHRGGDPIAVAVTATYETLTSMSAGALLAVLFLPALGVLPTEVAGKTTALFAVAALPPGLVVLNRLAARIARKRRGPHARPLPTPSVMLLALGLVHGAGGYCLLALSLGLTLHGVVPDAPPWTPDEFSAYLAAVALAYVIGFVVLFAPGGLGVRELVLAAFLASRLEPVLGEQAARGMGVVVALVLRLTWTVSELVLGIPLYLKKPAPYVAAHETTHA